MDLKGKRAIVTGGAMGIGFETVRRLVDAGALVMVWDLDKKALDAASTRLGAGKIRTEVCDITDRARVAALVSKADAEGGIDILVNNAGCVRGGNFHERPVSDWDLTYEVNLGALSHLTRLVLPGMYARGSGHVVSISSAAGVLGVSGLAAYSAAKWAVFGLMESLRHEARNLGAKGLRFSSVHPGYIATGMFEGAKIGGLGGLIVPLVKNHDVIAKAIVESCLKRGRKIVYRPRSVRTAPLLRGILPYGAFLNVIRFLGIHKSMQSWKGRS
jgi:all-trans-retinol dehydrogenase (NAD+)